MAGTQGVSWKHGGPKKRKTAAETPSVPLSYPDVSMKNESSAFPLFQFFNGGTVLVYGQEAAFSFS